MITHFYSPKLSHAKARGKTWLGECLPLHYVASLISEREKLTEYKRFAGIKVEIQIRSTLQHAWAEIEHDIGYKGENSVPDSLKRNFSRVAALLEVADIELMQLLLNPIFCLIQHP